MNQKRPQVRTKLVGLAEAAELLGISPAAFCDRRQRSRLGQARVAVPQPEAELRCGPIWQRSAIERYRRQFDLGAEQTAEQEAKRERERLARLERILMGIGSTG